MAGDSKSDRVYAQLKREIMSGEIAPGTSLSAIATGERLQASRTPIRQAFVRLEAEGLVTLVDRQGARVAPISIAGVRDLFELRMLLESTATGMVAESVRVDPSISAPFQQILDELSLMQGQSPSPERWARFYEIADEFDRAVVANTRNTHLSRSIAELRPHSARLRSIAHSTPDRLESSLVEHQRMCRAIISGDVAAAQTASAAHLEATEQTILDAVMNPAHVGRRPQIDLVTA
ncbi:GntR family transcriptional regulator [Rhodococcoides fascians]|uniref:GntR family transcriptional regulator n=1 Tax=Rhodococcoides fascians TaxID=1828 RepID=UPI00050BDE23|nr:GntR family transcriptional regulator [Rhodococcus fascians]MBY4403016.1 GntR family transcriptional regulator [Rhodococcus fascians]MBY4418876.1 GntR family transcriptional regulator [Rhodococcus fascians]